MIDLTLDFQFVDGLRTFSRFKTENRGLLLDYQTLDEIMAIVAARID